MLQGLEMAWVHPGTLLGSLSCRVFSILRLGARGDADFAV